MKSRWRSHIGVLGVSIGMCILAAWAFLPRDAAVALGLIVGTQMGLVMLMLFTAFGPVEEHYRKLAAARASSRERVSQGLTARSEYITSYRHLREHGNAFSIVILEGVLAYLLFRLPATNAFLLLAAWLLPATAAWVVGTALESRLVSRPLP